MFDRTSFIKKGVKFFMKKSLLIIFWVPFFATIPLSTPQRTYCANAADVRLVGHSDLQGRDALEVALKRNCAYVGHRGNKEESRDRSPRGVEKRWI